MALGDITMLQSNSAQGGRGARLYNVAAGTPILAGEPVQATLGGASVTPADTNTPVVGTTYFAGIAATNSTNTASAAGSVNVIPITAADTWLIAPAVAASWDTQAEYDALVGDRVLIQNNAQVGYSYSAGVNNGTYSLLASDSATSGCVVVALDIAKYPGKVAIAFRNGVNPLT